MTIDFEYYRKINGLNGATDKKDYLNKQVIKSINKSYDNALSTFEILINSNRSEDIIADGVNRKCIFDYSKTTNNKNTKTELASYTKEMWIEANVIDVGSIIKYTDKISLIENIYLVVSKQEDARGFDICYIQRANNILSFYSNESSLSYDIPCIVGNISIGTDSTTYITTVDNQVPLTIPNTDITRQIKPDDIYKIGMYNYKILSTPDDISIPGLLLFKMEYSATEQIIPVYTLSILNGSTLSTDTITPVQLNCQVLKDGIVLSPTPSLIFTSSDELVATVDSTGLVTPLIVGNVSITVKLSSDQTITDNISIDITEVPQNNYTYTLVGDIQPDSEIKSGQTKVFTAHKFNNGIEESGQFDFSIIDDGVPSAYTFTILNDTQCSIKCNSYTHYITLKSTDRNNGLFIEKQIKLRSIL